MLSERSQTIIVWWALSFLTIFGVVWVTLLKMAPPPAPSLPMAEVVAFYTENAFQIKLGAAIAAWTSAFWVPLSVVMSIQMARLEKGVPVWSILAFAGGILSSMFLVFPPIIWGVIAFDPGRAPESTLLLNQLANLTLVTTDQFYIFQMIALTVVSFNQAPDPNSAFPRWYGWANLWIAIIFEVGALGFMFKTGPFAWNGLFVFWFPFVFFFAWLILTAYCMLTAIKRQEKAAK